MRVHAGILRYPSFADTASQFLVIIAQPLVNSECFEVIILCVNHFRQPVVSHDGCYQDACEVAYPPPVTSPICILPPYRYDDFVYHQSRGRD